MRLVLSAITKVSVVLVASLALLSTEIAYSASPATPGAGSILQEIKPPASQSPSSNETGLQPNEKEPEVSHEAVTFQVNKIAITGNTLFTTQILHALVADTEGKVISLADLNKLADSITNFYHQHGYSLSQAYIPPQQIVEGLVTITIIEARYGKVILDNQSLVIDSLLNATLIPLHNATVISQNELDHVLLLFSDIPGVLNRSIFKPGEAVGTSDLLINASAVSRFNGSVSGDNYGNRYTGQNHLGGNLNFLDPFHHGDIFSLNVLSSGNEMNYGRLSECGQLI